MTNGQTDVLVIGAGPGGYPAAFHAADLGMRVTLVDPEPNPGGVCLYRGCVPSKALLHVASFLHDVELASQWGVSLGSRDVDRDKLLGWKASVVGRLTGGLGRLVKQRGIAYVRGTARLKDGHHAVVASSEEGERTVAFEHAIVATGSRPAVIPGVPESPRVMTSRQALDLEHVPATLLVVGGGYIGLELGQVYAALGSKVTLVEMLPEILQGADRDLVQVLWQRLENQFENVMTGTRVQEMQETEEGVRVSFEGGNARPGTFEKIMLAVGRKPFTEGVGLENVNVSFTERGFIEVDGQRRTGETSLFAVGDVAGDPMLAHKATHEGRTAVEAIAGRNAVFRPNAIPFVVFSDPQVAWCGLSENEAKQRNRAVKIVRFPWAASGRATTLSRNDGLTKMLSDPDTGRVLGVGIAGRDAGELLAEAVLAMEMGAVADDLALTIHTHPTLSETLMEAAEACSGHATHYRGRG